MNAQRPRLHFLSSHHGTGAAENLWLETALRLHQDGCAVRTAHCWNEVHSPRADALRQAGVEVQALRGRWPLGRLGRVLLSTSGAHRCLLKSWLGRQRPDLVLVSQGNDHSSLPWLEALHELNIPSAVVSHGIHGADWPSDQLGTRLRQAFARLRASFWVSQRNASDFEMQIGERLANCRRAFNPLKVRPQVLPWPQAEGVLRIACVARLQTRPKGHDLLLQAMASPPCRELPLQLSFFGNGENREGLQRLAALLGISARVEFHGHCDELTHIWRDHHLLAQPSRNEGMPLSLVEAMALGRPALATDVAGHSELVIEGETGFLANHPSVGEIAAALQRAWNQREALSAMGRHAHDRLKQWMPADPVADFAAQLLQLT